MSSASGLGEGKALEAGGSAPARVPESREELVRWFRGKDMPKAAEVLDHITTKVNFEKYTHSVLIILETGDLGDYIEFINDVMHGYRTQEGLANALFVYISKSDPNVIYLIFWREAA